MWAEQPTLPALSGNLVLSRGPLRETLEQGAAKSRQACEQEQLRYSVEREQNRREEGSQCSYESSNDIWQISPHFSSLQLMHLDAFEVANNQVSAAYGAPIVDLMGSAAAAPSLIETRILAASRTAYVRGVMSSKPGRITRPKRLHTSSSGFTNSTWFTPNASPSSYRVMTVGFLRPRSRLLRYCWLKPERTSTSS